MRSINQMKYYLAMKMDILQLFTTWMNLLNMMWFWARKQLENKEIHVRNEDGSYSGEEVGSGAWETWLWDAGNIYLMVYEVAILMCSFSDDLLTWTLKLCSIFVGPMSTQKFKQQFPNLTGEYIEKKYAGNNHSETYIWSFTIQ